MTQTQRTEQPGEGSSYSPRSKAAVSWLNPARWDAEAALKGSCLQGCCGKQPLPGTARPFALISPNLQTDRMG